jgi:hypothetical protein
MNRGIVLFIGFAIAVTVGVSHGDDENKAKKASLAVGKKVKDLRFKDIRYLPRSITEFGKRKAYVIVASTVSCPMNARYWPKLKTLNTLYKDKNVQFMALNVEAKDSVKDMADQAVEYGVPFPFLKDMNGSCIRKLGLTTTAQVVVLDETRHIRYRGRIDNQYRLGGGRPDVNSDDLKNALNAVLADKKVATPETPVDGCRIQFQKLKYSGSKIITYSKDIAPLMQKHCQDCHRTGGLAPFNLMTYDDVSKNAGMIAEVVAEGRMPPWYASEKSKGFHNYRGLSSYERSAIVHWAKNGTKQGDPKDEPRALVFPKAKWEIGKPDLIMSVPNKIDLPAEGYVKYQYFFINGQFPHDRWIEAIEIRPENNRVLHHCNMLYSKFNKDGTRTATTFVTGVVPGSGATFAQKGTAFKIPKGATIILQAHYTTTGKPESDRLSVGLRFSRDLVKKEIHSVRASNRRFSIPAGAPHHKVRGSIRLRGEALGIGLFSHMHLRGKAMTFSAHYPDGTKEKLLTVPNYSFDWQQSYRWKLGSKIFPKGTKIVAVGIYDNSKFNPFNPDASKNVGYGPQTYHEMMFGFFFYVLKGENIDLSIDPKTGKVAKRRFF